jgi:hypothetical protein
VGPDISFRTFLKYAFLRIAVVAVVVVVVVFSAFVALQVAESLGIPPNRAAVIIGAIAITPIMLYFWWTAWQFDQEQEDHERTRCIEAGRTGNGLMLTTACQEKFVADTCLAAKHAGYADTKASFVFCQQWNAS